MQPKNYSRADPSNLTYRRFHDAERNLSDVASGARRTDVRHSVDHGLRCETNTEEADEETRKEKSNKSTPFPRTQGDSPKKGTGYDPYSRTPEERKSGGEESNG